MRDVKVGNGALGTKIPGVLGERSAGVAGSGNPDPGIDRLRPGIRTDEAEALAHARFRAHGHSIEVGVADRRNIAAGNIAVGWKWTAAGDGTRSRKGLVDIPLYWQFVSLRSKVRNIKDKIRGELALHAKAPLIDVRRSEVRVDSRRNHRRDSGECIRDVRPIRGLKRPRRLPQAER